MLQATKRAVAGQRWDYRWQPVPRKCKLMYLKSQVVHFILKENSLKLKFILHHFLYLGKKVLVRNYIIVNLE